MKIKAQILCRSGLCAAAWLLALAALAADPAPPAELGWPRVFTKDGNEVVVHQPQIDSWVDYRSLEARSAVAVKSAAESETLYGVLKLKAATRLDRESRTVLLEEPDLSVKFPNAPAGKATAAETVLRGALPNRKSMTISLDRVLAFLDAGAAAQRPVKVNFDPPPIYYSDKPAILVVFTGPPEFQPVKGTGLMAAVNTNWDLFLDAKESKYYLLDGDAWLTSPDPVKGPWTAAKAPPPDLAKLPADENWAEARAAAKAAPASEIPAVFASAVPAELIATEGAPKYSPVSGTALMAVSNTESPVFLLASEGNHYFTVAGRWFRAKELAGPWSAATADLPAEFAKIPEDSPHSSIRVNVPGTEEARDAILLASTPEMASVKKNATIQVQYSGEPKFKPIEATSVSYAVNTSDQVFLVEGKYYCCRQGVWFTAPAASGSWSVCAAVPPAIYSIPSGHPMHNVTYVYVYENGGDDVSVGYTAGYRGQYVAAGLLLFGAGYALGEAADDGDIDVYHHYGPSWYSYGCGALYNPYYGGYYRAAAHYGPYGGAGRGAYYNSATGTWGRGAYVYGPEGSAWARQSYNPWTGAYKAQTGGSNVYGSWSQGYVSRGDEWARGGRVATDEGKAGWTVTSRGGAAAGYVTDDGTGAFRATTGQGAKAAGVKTENREGAAVKTKDGDLYVGNDDNIYKREDGSWYKNEGGDWNEVSRERPESPEAKPKVTVDASDSKFQSSAPDSSAAKGAQNTAAAPRTSGSAATRDAQRTGESSGSAASRDKTWGSRQSSTSDFGSQLGRQANARLQGERGAARTQRSAAQSRSASSSRPSASRSRSGGSRSGGRR